MTTRKRTVAFAALCFVLAGCSITKTIEPVKSTRINQVCVLDNPKVLMDEFQPEVLKQIQQKGFATKVYSGQRPNECSHHVEYTATWAWDLAMYLTYAEFRVYDRDGVAGQAVYDARWGGGRLDKFGPTAEKIRPLIDQLFASATPDPTMVPALATPAAGSGAGGDKAARLQELQRLKDQGLVTDEEYATKRQTILDEI